MTIKIAYPPKGGSDAKPTRLTKRFIAVGTKASNEHPLGVMLSVGMNGDADHKFRVGGTTFYKNDTSTGLQWAMHFNMPPKVPRNQRFKLVVFDTQKLPNQVEAQTLGADQTRDFLFLKGPCQHGHGGGSHNGYS